MIILLRFTVQLLTCMRFHVRVDKILLLLIMYDTKICNLKS